MKSYNELGIAEYRDYDFPEGKFNPWGEETREATEVARYQFHYGEITVTSLGAHYIANKVVNGKIISRARFDDFDACKNWIIKRNWGTGFGANADPDATSRFGKR
jgi:hypothetical protein